MAEPHKTKLYSCNRQGFIYIIDCQSAIKPTNSLEFSYIFKITAIYSIISHCSFHIYYYDESLFFGFDVAAMQIAEIFWNKNRLKLTLNSKVLIYHNKKKRKPLIFSSYASKHVIQMIFTIRCYHPVLAK